ncbi:MlaD family protein [Trichloromonas sp.]|uniref:MlaD family protein n=1 Tax=Trichloromonas sp. TaxID=3069249 RepID=UPI002A3D690C|nr:MlaD family protein [Trichloromonas sp.]
MAMSTEKRVGIFFLLTLCVLAVMIELAEDWRPFSKQKEYHTFFRTAVGLKLGDPVRMAGVEVGKILNISLADSRVRIDFFVTEATDLREDSVAEIRQTNLLGGQFLGLEFGSPQSSALPEGSALPSVERANIDQLITSFDRNQERVFGQIGSLMEQSRDSIVNASNRLESILMKIDEGSGSLGRMVNHPGLYDDFSGSLSELKTLLEGLRNGEGTFGRLLTDATLHDDAVRVVADLREITDGLKNGEGTLGRLLTDKQLYERANAAVADLGEVAKKANNGTGSLGKLVNDEALYQEVLASVERINSIAAKIDRGEGSLGRLVNEDSLYRDAVTTLRKVEKAMDGMSDAGPVSALGTVVGTLF